MLLLREQLLDQVFLPLMGFFSADELRSHWAFRSGTEFRGLPSTASNFSPDGSLLAVAFDAVLTLWSTKDHNSLVGTLSQPFLTERIL